MKYLITYNPRQKSLLEWAINMAVSWKDGIVYPVCDLFIKIYEREHPVVEDMLSVKSTIIINMGRIRDIDTERVIFGNKEEIEALKSIHLDESGQSCLTQAQAAALEKLTGIVSRLICAQLDIVFYSNILLETKNNFHKELKKIALGLSAYCWNLNYYETYGVHYDDESDILYDIHQVLRYEHYLNISEDEKEKQWWGVRSRKPLRFGPEPLMGIKTIK